MLKPSDQQGANDAASIAGYAVELTHATPPVAVKQTAIASSKVFIG